MSRLAHLRCSRVLLTWLISVLFGVIVAVSGAGMSVEKALDEADAGLRRQPGSGSLLIVEIDARSLAAINRWPWPRGNYAELVDRLRRAGAASIVFDVDFSAHGDPQGDAEFGAALERAGGTVVLPTFSQRAGGGSEDWTDALPIPVLRDHAALAAVSILPDRDGQVTRAPLGTVTGGLPRPSLSAILADADGEAYRDYPIDFAIDPETIPRHSFVDIRDGRFNPSEIAGKRILIGATAVEMGDRYAVPNYGVIPGVVIQALAAETLRRGIPRELGPLPALIIGLAIAWQLLRIHDHKLLGGFIIAAPLLLFGLATTAAAFFHCTTDLVPALAALTAASISAVVLRLAATAQRRRMHDPQTGLPNRFALHAIGQTEVATGIVAARISEFDKLAAALGDEAVGDLIYRVHDRLRLIVGSSPIYRVDDRVLAWCCDDDERLEQQLSTLRTLMLNPVEIGGRRVDVTLAFGFARAALQERPDAILARSMHAADKALTSGEAWQVHDEQAQEEATRELSLLGELDDAIGKGEIDVFYQPKLCLKTRRIVSVEALVRWNHGIRGSLRPDLFIPLAERNDRIAGLTLHVLEKTMNELADWRAQGREISGAVNISAKLLNSHRFINDLRQMVETGVVPTRLLTFEVTESAAMRNTEDAARALRAFQELGIAISMDDYGTGQSTLSYLKQLPLNELKIDRSFVQFAHQSRSDGLLVQSTVNLAHELGLKVVAEGVEDEACLAYLATIGCDMAQGYLISRPIPAAELKALLGRRLEYAA